MSDDQYIVKLLPFLCFDGTIGARIEYRALADNKPLLAYERIPDGEFSPTPRRLKALEKLASSGKSFGFEFPNIGSAAIFLSLAVNGPDNPRVEAQGA